MRLGISCNVNRIKDAAHFSPKDRIVQPSREKSTNCSVRDLNADAINVNGAAYTEQKQGKCHESGLIRHSASSTNFENSRMFRKKGCFHTRGPIECRDMPHVIHTIVDV